MLNLGHYFKRARVQWRHTCRIYLIEAGGHSTAVIIIHLVDALREFLLTLVQMGMLIEEKSLVLQ